MKKLVTLICVICLTFQITSCKKEAKKEKPKKPAVVEKTFSHSLKKAENSINFIAYKTSEKVPVKGMFKKIEIIKAGEGNSVLKSCLLHIL